MSQADQSASEDQETLPAEDGSVVAFEHRIFTFAPDAYFRRSEHVKDEPVLVMSLAENEVSLPFPGIKREFDIDGDSPDGKMLHKVAEGLKFVKVLRLGDPIPTEVLTGEASWEIQSRHRLIAYQRLAMQLVSWLTGEETTSSDPDQLLRIANDPVMKGRINEAISEVAEHLGIGRARKDEVLKLIENLAEDFAGLEALRDKAQIVRMIHTRVQRLCHNLGGEQSILEVGSRVSRLMEVARKDIRGRFEQVDSKTGQIIELLENAEAMTLYIRKVRNDLYSVLMPWDEMFELWEDVTGADSDMAPGLLRQTYRFLAPRYMQEDKWVLSNRSKAPKTKRTQMVW